MNEHGTEIFRRPLKESVGFEGGYLAGHYTVCMIERPKRLSRQRKDVRENQYVYGEKRVIYIGYDFGSYRASNRYHYHDKYT